MIGAIAILAASCGRSSGPPSSLPPRPGSGAPDAPAVGPQLATGAGQGDFPDEISGPGSGQYQSDANQAPTPVRTPFRVPPGVPSPGELVATISITPEGYRPNYIMAPIGTTFMWVNNDVATHSVTHDEGDFSLILPPGATQSEYCADPGEYKYHDIYTGFTGDNVVEFSVTPAQFLAQYRGEPIPSPGPTVDPSIYANDTTTSATDSDN